MWTVSSVAERHPLKLEVLSSILRRSSNAGVAQWQCSAPVMRRLGVQVLSPAPKYLLQGFP